MNKKNVIKSIRKSSDLVSKINLLRSFVKPSLLGVDKDFMKLSFNFDTPYEEIYLAGLEKQNYNIILNDYSYFQFNYRDEENRDCKLPYARYAYYPNPFSIEEENLEEIYKMYKDYEITFEEYSQAISEYKPIIKQLPIRYDLSFSQYKQIQHPVAHLHFSLSEDSRISTNKIFLPETFTMMILNLYYFQNWVLYNSDNEEFALDKEYKNNIDTLNHIKNFNISGTSTQYYCDLQESLLNFK